MSWLDYRQEDDGLWGERGRNSRGQWGGSGGDPPGPPSPLVTFCGAVPSGLGLAMEFPVWALSSAQVSTAALSYLLRSG